jgi:hypothetical protein
MPNKTKMTLLIDPPVAMRLRKSVRETPTRFTISEVANEALKRAAGMLERWYNEGQPFANRKHPQLNGGRPPKRELKSDLAVKKQSEKLTVHIDNDVAVRFRNAIYFSPTHETIANVATRALAHASKLLERKRKVADRTYLKNKSATRVVVKGR